MPFVSELALHAMSCTREIVKYQNSIKWLPVIVEELCTGCGLCVAACGPACLETQNQVAVLERPIDCGSEEHCISACPEDAIHMVWLPAEGDSSIGLWRSLSDMKFKSGTRKASSLLAHNRK
jgi:ferredoxin